ncbi:Alpha/Beta hydrolase protein [Mycena metata]|uniref:Alpha/Beta hydrolase protein n=1 Tax=Mycena metata TaxID=1033252 RepID=A0AAD7HS07_9AGAR|nr:Alpha/Beta hydrolase protein [Mycena metata]
MWYFPGRGGRQSLHVPRCPFAQPAVRFSLPQPATLLHGVQNATAFGLACPQQALSALALPVTLPDEGIVSEDCLKLNVFASSLRMRPRQMPSSQFSSPTRRFRNRKRTGHGRATRGRAFHLHCILNPAFGCLAGKEVGDEGITNIGLRDQIFALKWVREHIGAFGGDAARVVIGGPSVGAISAALLLLDNKQFKPSALFRGPFMSSGSPVTTGSVADGQPHYDELIRANPLHGFGRHARVPENIWRPRVDGDVLVHNPLVSVSKGLYAKVPFMTGDADDDGTLFSPSNTNITWVGFFHGFTWDLTRWYWTDEEFVGYIYPFQMKQPTLLRRDLDID